MLFFDTDHMTLLEWGGRASRPLRERLAASADQNVTTTIIKELPPSRLPSAESFCREIFETFAE